MQSEVGKWTQVHTGTTVQAKGTPNLDQGASGSNFAQVKRGSRVAVEVCGEYGSQCVHPSLAAVLDDNVCTASPRRHALDKHALCTCSPPVQCKSTCNAQAQAHMHTQARSRHQRHFFGRQGTWLTKQGHLNATRLAQPGCRSPRRHPAWLHPSRSSTAG